MRVSCLDRPGYVGSCLRRHDGWGCGNQGTRGEVGVKEGREGGWREAWLCLGRRGLVDDGDFGGDGDVAG